MRDFGRAEQLKHITPHIEPRDGAARFQRHAAVPTDFQLERDRRVRGGKGHRHVAVAFAHRGGFGRMAGIEFAGQRIGREQLRQNLDLDRH